MSKAKKYKFEWVKFDINDEKTWPPLEKEVFVKLASYNKTLENSTAKYFSSLPNTIDNYDNVHCDKVSFLKYWSHIPEVKND